MTFHGYCCGQKRPNNHLTDIALVIKINDQTRITTTAVAHLLFPILLSRDIMAEVKRFYESKPIPDFQMWSSSTKFVCKPLTVVGLKTAGTTAINTVLVLQCITLLPLIYFAECSISGMN